ncbi:E3 ubiquitin-protein ligase TRIM17-like [Ptychodera flava]|uniref:E3 ubiquitin-protein ligase TRIM17-like n=1 Tax=Ptychodera flava TaxID=63121 RepID=UPI00396A805F
MESEELPLKIPVKALLENLTCPICMSVLNDTYMTRCGHRYCKECIKECVNRRHKCPCCNADIASVKELVHDHQFNLLIQIIKNEKSMAEENYFQTLINAAVSTVTSDQGSSTHSPVEEVLKKHLKEGLAAHENYYQQMKRQCRQQLQCIESDMKNKVDELQRNGSAGTELEQQLTALKAKFEEQKDTLLGEFQKCSNMVSDAYDRYLSEMLPTPAILPVNVTLVLLDKEISLPDVKLKPNDSTVEIQEMLKCLMEAKEDPIVDFAEDVQFMLVGPFAKRSLYETHQLAKDVVHHNAVHTDVVLLLRDSKPVLEFGAKPGSEIVIIGQVKCKSDLPKQCFARVFEAGTEQIVDYFTCHDCKFNWVCKSCMESCHKEHKTVPYIMNHHPTWACCYCTKKKKCIL